MLFPVTSHLSEIIVWIKLCTIKHDLQVNTDQNAYKQSSVDFDMSGQQGMDFLHRGRIIKD